MQVHIEFLDDNNCSPICSVKEPVYKALTGEAADGVSVSDTRSGVCRFALNSWMTVTTPLYAA